MVKYNVDEINDFLDEIIENDLEYDKEERLELFWKRLTIEQLNMICEVEYVAFFVSLYTYVAKNSTLSFPDWLNSCAHKIFWREEVTQLVPKLSSQAALINLTYKKYMECTSGNQFNPFDETTEWKVTLDCITIENQGNIDKLNAML